MRIGETIPASSRVEVADYLRGFAALAVCCFHMTHAGTLIAWGWLASLTQWGWLGVEVFFVISGFVIPMALHASHFQRNDYSRFLVKRIARLEPPYLISLFLVITLGFFSSRLPGYRGEPFHFDLANTLGHIGYLNGFLGWTWADPVYWSLAIEFQYYLSVGLLFPLLISRQSAVFALAVCALLSLGALIPSRELIFIYLPLFALGITAFRWRIRNLHSWWDCAPIIFSLLLLFQQRDWQVTMVAVGTALILAFVPNRTIVRSSWLGLISYSLYLVHVPVGGRVVNLASRFATGPWSQLGACLLGLIASLLVAILFYLAVERPARRWSSRLSTK